ncbi:MAG TPA: AAA family ATPase, partial [Kofleriaceae bacterium]
GSFLFLGPTGVGKTELGKALAHELFGDESAALTFDMSEYAERHTASLLVGSPNGYVNSEDGGRLTNAVRARPFQVIVLDEIEKAHPDVINLLLQVLEEGRLSDRWGPVDFKNTIIIMTSNAILEAPKAKTAIGFAAGGRDEPRGDPGDAALRRALIGRGWRPELVNRVDGAALFNKLDARSLDAIVDKTLREVGRAYGIGVRASRAARDELLRRGTDPDLGARPIRRAAQAVEDVVADSVLSGSREREVEVDYSDGHFLAKRPGVDKGRKPKRPSRGNPRATRAAGPGRGR